MFKDRILNDDEFDLFGPIPNVSLYEITDDGLTLLDNNLFIVFNYDKEKNEFLYDHSYSSLFEKESTTLLNFYQIRRVVLILNELNRKLK